MDPVPGQTPEAAATPTPDRRPEQQQLLNNAQTLAREIATSRPQQDPQGRINYYFAGSLATDLLAGATQVEIMDDQQLPNPTVSRVITISSEARAILGDNFLRKIGDLDYLQFPHYAQEYPLEQRLGKGGSFPYDQLTSTAQAALKEHGIFMDALDTPQHAVARIQIGGMPVYIAEPGSIFAFKTVHVAEGFHHEAKTDKLLRDFPILLDAMSRIYPRQELVEQTRDAALKYASLPNVLLIPYDNPRFTPEMRAFFDEMIAQDPDAHYLEQIHFDNNHEVKTRAVDILNILHHFDSPEAKMRMAQFMGSHADKIDLWTWNPTSEKNRAVAAAFIANNPDVLQAFLASQGPGRVAKYKELYGENPDGNPHMDTAAVEQIFKDGLMWDSVVRRYADHPNFPQGEMIMQPNASELLSALYRVSPSLIETELGIIGRVSDQPRALSSFRRLLEVKQLKNTDYRAATLNRVETASQTLSPDDFNRFLSKLEDVLSQYIGGSFYDTSIHEYRTIDSEETRQVFIAGTYAEFGLDPIPQPNEHDTETETA